MRRILVLAVVLASLVPAWATPPTTLVVFVHGRYEDASSANWIDDNPAQDAAVAAFDLTTPMGKQRVFGVSDGQYLRMRIRECYWRLPRGGSVSETVEKRVGRLNCLYVRYDAKESWYYEPKCAPLVADEVRAWLLADPARLEASRNIVWIAHSNGGIVVRALMSDPQYADLVGRTREVITLGTPHRGSEMADAGQDTDRVEKMTDALVQADSTLGAAIRVVNGRFTVFKMLAPNLAPYLEDIKKQVYAEAPSRGWKKTELGPIVQRSRALFVARMFVGSLSGRIDEQLTTAFMEATQRPDAYYRLLPAAELPVPFWWVRGDLYPMDPLEMVGGVFRASSWDHSDLLYFVVSVGVVSPQLAKRWPDHPMWQRSDGVVSVESAAALGQPLEGSATFAVHHGDLIYHRRVRDLIDRHLSRAPAGVPPASSPRVPASSE